MGDKITSLADYVTQTEHESGRAEQRHLLRRESDRIDRLRLDVDSLSVTVIGEHGTNGLKSVVGRHEVILPRIERVIWIVFASAVGIVAWLVRGSIV